MNQDEFELFQEFLEFKRMKEQQASLDAEQPKKEFKKKKKQTKSKYSKRKDGRYEACIMLGYDETGKKLTKHLYGKTIVELDTKVNELKLEIAKGTNFGKQSMKFKEFREYWWNTKLLSIKTVNTKNMYLNVFTYLVSIDYIALKDITSQDVQNVINENKAKARTCQKIKTCLNEIFKFAIKERIIYYNPCDGLVLPKYKAKERRPLTYDEHYLTDLNIFNDMERAFICLIKYCGLRKAEALALVKNDFNENNNTLTISKALYKDTNKMMLKDTKNGLIRHVPVPNVICQFLRYYIRNLKGDLLFHTKYDATQYFSETIYRTFWKNIIKKLKTAAKERNMTIGDDLTAHIFRHNYACELMNANIDMKERQYLLGHTTIGVTMDIYTHIEATKMQAPKLLNDYLNQNKKN